MSLSCLVSHIECDEHEVTVPLAIPLRACLEERASGLKQPDIIRQRAYIWYEIAIHADLPEQFIRLLNFLRDIFEILGEVQHSSSRVQSRGRYGRSQNTPRVLHHKTDDDVGREHFESNQDH